MAKTWLITGTSRGFGALIAEQALERGDDVVATARFGRIDILLTKAGFGLLGAVEEATSQEIEHAYATNVFGVLDTNTEGLLARSFPRPSSGSVW